MKYTNTNVAIQKEILKKKTGGEITSPITITFGDATIVKGGSPIGSNGAVANTSAAVGILLYDVTPDRPIGTIVKGAACVNLANAESNSGLTIASAVKTALPGIIFE